jgi:hypothetical protein
MNQFAGRSAWFLFVYLVKVPSCLPSIHIDNDLSAGDPKVVTGYIRDKLKLF